MPAKKTANDGDDLVDPDYTDVLSSASRNSGDKVRRDGTILQTTRSLVHALSEASERESSWANLQSRQPSRAQSADSPYVHDDGDGAGDNEGTGEDGEAWHDDEDDDEDPYERAARVQQELLSASAGADGPPRLPPPAQHAGDTPAREQGLAEGFGTAESIPQGGVGVAAGAGAVHQDGREIQFPQPSGFTDQGAVDGSRSVGELIDHFGALLPKASQISLCLCN